MPPSATAAGDSTDPNRHRPSLPARREPLVGVSTNGKFASSGSLQSAWKELSADADAASRATAPPQPQPQPPDTMHATEAAHTQLNGKSDAPAAGTALPVDPTDTEACRPQGDADAPPQLPADSSSLPAATAIAMHGGTPADPQVEPTAATRASAAAASEPAQGPTDQAAVLTPDAPAAADAVGQPKARSRRDTLFRPRGPARVAAGPRQIAVHLLPGTPPVMVDAVPGMTAQQAEQQAAERAGLTRMNPGKPDLADIFGPWANPTREELRAVPGYQSEVQSLNIASPILTPAVCVARTFCSGNMHRCARDCHTADYNRRNGKQRCFGQYVVQ